MAYKDYMRNLGFFSLAFALLPVTANALTCEQFKAAVIQAAALHQSPAPTFHMSPIRSTDHNNRIWDIQLFDEIRAMVFCRRGSVNTFAAYAKDNQAASSAHLAALMGMALYGYGLEWRSALLLRDKLVSTAETSNPHTAKIPFGARKASLIVSIAGVPNFQIDTE